MAFIELYLHVSFFVHRPTVVVGDDESLSDHVFGSVFEYERVSYLFGFFVGVVDIEKIITNDT